MSTWTLTQDMPHNIHTQCKTKRKEKISLGYFKELRLAGYSYLHLKTVFKNLLEVRIFEAGYSYSSLETMFKRGQIGRACLAYVQNWTPFLLLRKQGKSCSTFCWILVSGRFVKTWLVWTHYILCTFMIVFGRTSLKAEENVIPLWWNGPVLSVLSVLPHFDPIITFLRCRAEFGDWPTKQLKPQIWGNALPVPAPPN